MGGLEASLTSLMQEHALRNNHLKNTAEKAKKDALAAAAWVSEVLVDSVNGGVKESYINEKQIELETRALVSTVQRFIKQTNQWLTMVHSLDTALKEVGDFENWVKVMEYDCESIGNAVKHLSLISGRTMV